MRVKGRENFCTGNRTGRPGRESSMFAFGRSGARLVRAGRYVKVRVNALSS
jgi:hypothetical protein